MPMDSCKERTKEIPNKRHGLLTMPFLYEETGEFSTVRWKSSRLGLRKFFRTFSTGMLKTLWEIGGFSTATAEKTTGRGYFSKKFAKTT
ncbi:hypothetical protein SUBVAR_07132 [Subdoligranulum variabile DSM 15176]|uniref:Uncharacterized protein n=1 Tax=Subdoligranulum variabile DSM 15176 TaxID=411471 RepID=D1PRV0_9FIRM|nr:hypothetical protein SUBVAR_07132 [Subdoligranulum variabile DSM 15176]